MKRSASPHFEILGAPLDDILFCGKCVAQKRAEALHLLKQLEEVDSVDPQVAVLLLKLCGSFIVWCTWLDQLLPHIDL